jgi:hypothetical protein
MQKGRRSFLATAVSGLGALVGLLWPKRAAALGRRSHNCYSPCPPMECVPRRAGDNVIIAFPPQPNPTPFGVPGGPDFYIWGIYNSSSVKMYQATITRLGGGTPIPGILQPDPPNSSSTPNGWSPFGFFFRDVPTGVALTLAVRYGDMATSYPGDSVPSFYLIASR